MSEVTQLFSSDHAAIFEFLIRSSRSSERHKFTLDGRSEFDLVKLARSLPSADLSPEHAEAIRQSFVKPQHGYYRTGVNLAHRANTNFTRAARQASMNSRYPGHQDAMRSLHDPAGRP